VTRRTDELNDDLLAAEVPKVYANVAIIRRVGQASNLDSLRLFFVFIERLGKQPFDPRAAGCSVKQLSNQRSLSGTSGANEKHLYFPDKTGPCCRNAFAIIPNTVSSSGRLRNFAAMTQEGMNCSDEIAQPRIIWASIPVRQVNAVEVVETARRPYVVEVDWNDRASSERATCLSMDPPGLDRRFRPKGENTFGFTKLVFERVIEPFSGPYINVIKDAKTFSL
jgi:hypothetical protein